MSSLKNDKKRTRAAPAPAAGASSSSLASATKPVVVPKQKQNKTSKATLSDSSDNDSDEGELDTDREGEILPVEFDFFNFTDTDFHAVKRFFTMALGPDAGDQLQGLVDLTDVVLSQKFGTGVKCDGEESDPYAITSLVGLTGPQWGTNTTTAPLRDLLRTRSSSSVEADAQRLEKLLSETATGRTALLLHERLINMPWQVSAPLFRLLLDEVAATKTKVDTVVLLCPMFRPDGDDGDGAEEDDGDQGEDAPPAQKRAKAAIIRDQLLGKKAKKAKKKTVAKRAEALAAHAYLELEYLEKIAEYTFHFKHASSGSETDNMTALQGVKGSRRGLVVKWSKLAAVVAELESLVQESEALITQERVDHDDDDDE